MSAKLCQPSFSGQDSTRFKISPEIKAIRRCGSVPMVRWSAEAVASWNVGVMSTEDNWGCEYSKFIETYRKSRERFGMFGVADGMTATDGWNFRVEATDFRDKSRWWLFKIFLVYLVVHTCSLIQVGVITIEYENYWKLKHCIAYPCFGCKK